LVIPAISDSSMPTREISMSESSRGLLKEAAGFWIAAARSLSRAPW
jgi:hypothetical protein